MVELGLQLRHNQLTGGRVVSITCDSKRRWDGGNEQRK